MPKRKSIASRLLFALAEMAEFTADQLDVLLLSSGSVSQLKRNLKILDKQYYSAFQGLQANGYIKKVNNNQFLISPKALEKIHKEKELKKIKWDKKKWDGQWVIASFDIPEDQRRKREIFRSAIKRMGFIRLQNSVFISPFAELEELSSLRAELEIEKYVTFFKAKICETENDSKLRKFFGL